MSGCTGIGDGKEKRFNSIEYSHDVCLPITDENFRVGLTLYSQCHITRILYITMVMSIACSRLACTIGECGVPWHGLVVCTLASFDPFDLFVMSIVTFMLMCVYVI
jgi:hypothetical protein